MKNPWMIAGASLFGLMMLCGGGALLAIRGIKAAYEEQVASARQAGIPTSIDELETWLDRRAGVASADALARTNRFVSAVEALARFNEETDVCSDSGFDVTAWNPTTRPIGDAFRDHRDGVRTQLAVFDAAIEDGRPLRVTTKQLMEGEVEVLGVVAAVRLTNLDTLCRIEDGALAEAAAVGLGRLDRLQRTLSGLPTALHFMLRQLVIRDRGSLTRHLAERADSALLAELAPPPELTIADYIDTRIAETAGQATFVWDIVRKDPRIASGTKIGLMPLRVIYERDATLLIGQALDVYTRTRDWPTDEAPGTARLQRLVDRLKVQDLAIRQDGWLFARLAAPNNSRLFEDMIRSADEAAVTAAGIEAIRTFRRTGAWPNEAGHSKLTGARLELTAAASERATVSRPRVDGLPKVEAWTIALAGGGGGGGD